MDNNTKDSLCYCITKILILKLQNFYNKQILCKYIFCINNSFVKYSFPKTFILTLCFPKPSKMRFLQFFLNPSTKIKVQTNNFSTNKLIYNTIKAKTKTSNNEQIEKNGKKIGSKKTFLIRVGHLVCTRCPTHPNEMPMTKYVSARFQKKNKRLKHVEQHKNTVFSSKKGMKNSLYPIIPSLNQQKDQTGIDIKSAVFA